MSNAPVGQRIADLAAAQWGMLTTAQARVHGVARANLAHRVRSGTLERTDHYGVYRLTSAQSGPLDDLRAAWLSTNPEELAPDRARSPRPDAVVASAAAGRVHGIGDVYASPYRIIVPARRQSTTGNIAYSWRPLDSHDIEVVDGLPVTTRERTIVDLLVDEGDVSIAADALRDALRGQYDLDEDRLAELLAPHADRLGQEVGDGVGALEQLMVTAEVDAASEATRALDRLLVSKVALPGIEAFLKTFATNLPALAGPLPVLSPATAAALTTGMDALLAPTREALKTMDTAALSGLLDNNRRLIEGIVGHPALDKQAQYIANLSAGLTQWAPPAPTIRITSPLLPDVSDEEAARARRTVERTGPGQYRLRKRAGRGAKATPPEATEDGARGEE